MTVLRSEEMGDGIAVVRLNGELDKFAADDALAQIDALAAPSGLVIDLSELTFLDSAGLHALFSAARSAQERGTRIAFLLPQPSPIQRVLDLVQIGQVAPLRHSEADAIAAVRPETVLSNEPA
jgi:anti-sigma B factor antagonist